MTSPSSDLRAIIALLVFQIVLMMGLGGALLQSPAMGLKLDRAGPS